MDDQSQIDSQILQELFEYGFMGLEIPLEHGGSGMNFTSSCLVIEEIARVDPSVAIFVDIQNTLINNAIRSWGSVSVQNKYLPRLAKDTVSSFCLSEPTSGSDAFSLKTTASKSADGSYYTLNGSKLWISSAREAGLFLVFANTDMGLGYKGITGFLVDAKAGGVEIGQPEKKMGLRASSTCPISFEEVKVSSQDILGKVGKGYKYCIEILNEGRIGIGAQQLGIAKGCMDIAIPYILERKQFGVPVATFQGMQHQYSQLATDVHAVEVMLYNACRLKESGETFVKEASMVKLFSSQVAERVASKSIELMGGAGFTRDFLTEKFFRDSKVGSIYEGTSNMQLQTIAQILMKEYDE